MPRGRRAWLLLPSQLCLRGLVNTEGLRAGHVRSRTGQAPVSDLRLQDTWDLWGTVRPLEGVLPGERHPAMRMCVAPQEGAGVVLGVRRLEALF